MRRPAIFVVLAGIAAMVAAMVVYSALKRREAQVQQAMAQSVDIVVAAHDLTLGTRLDAGALKSVRWSRDSLPPGAIMDPLTGDKSQIQHDPQKFNYLGTANKEVRVCATWATAPAISVCCGRDS